jgi:ribosomal protein S18 acetylase RimI-like enzyme
MSSWIVRPAIELDAAGVARLCVEVNPVRESGEQESTGFWERFFLGALGSEDAALIVAEARSQIIGFAYAEIEHSSDVESWAHEKGMKVIQLAVAESNLSAFKLYEGLGYRTVMRKMQKEL